MRARTRLAAATLGLGLTVSLAACGSDDNATAGGSGGASTTPPAASPTSDAPASTPAASPTSVATSAPAVTPQPTAASSTVAGIANCRTSALQITLSNGEGAAGTSYYNLVFRNAGSTTCQLRGYPGVSFVGGDDGHQIGVPAKEDTSSQRIPVNLAPGASAHVVLGIADAGNYDAATCKVTTARGLRVYPPGEKASAFVQRPLQACSSQSVSLMTVKAMRPGTSG